MSAMDAAIKEIDMNRHRGEHPRMGAVDVIPFIPVRNVSMDEAKDLARRLAEEAAGGLTCRYTCTRNPLPSPKGKTWLT